MQVQQTARLIACPAAAKLAAELTTALEQILEPRCSGALAICDVEKPDQQEWRLRVCVSDQWSHGHLRMEQAQASDPAAIRAALAEKLKDFLAARRRVAFKIRPGTYPGDSLTNLRLTLNTIPGMASMGLKLQTDVEFIPCTAVVSGTCFKINDFLLEVDACVRDEVSAALERQGFEVENINPIAV
ncbi:MAG: hypothetical protein HKL95_01440 [Phycisphaerae bacterium]|nr:hypothetical protein [Phycisphaerae bacterium]